MSADAEVLEELDAALHTVTAGLQGLLDLLGDRDDARPMRAEGLRYLLQPLSDQAEQASAAADLLLRRLGAVPA